MKLVGAKHLCKVSLIRAINLCHKCFARTGQGKFIVVLVDLDTHKLMGLVSSRTQSAIEKVMAFWGENVLAQIEEVSIDMSGNYKSLVQKICPNAVITVDRFHVTKMIHEELNQVRINQKQTNASNQ